MRMLSVAGGPLGAMRTALFSRRAAPPLRRPRSATSEHRHAAGDRHEGARHEAALPGGEQHVGRRQFRGLAGAAQRRPRAELRDLSGLFTIGWIGVQTGPGATQFTRMPCGASRFDRPMVRLAIAPLVAA